MKAIVFLGGGRITNALVAGLRLAKYDKPILVHDRNPGKLRQLKKQYGVAVEPNLQRAVERSATAHHRRAAGFSQRSAAGDRQTRKRKAASPADAGQFGRWHPAFETASAIAVACTLGTSHAQSCVPQRARTYGFDFRLCFLSHREARR